MDLAAAFIDQLRENFPSDALVLGEATRAAYGYDNSRRESRPDSVVFPPAHDEVIALVAACKRHRVPLTARADQALPLVFQRVIELDSTLSGEHGIGIAKRDFMPQALGSSALSMMREVKGLFDPEHILNPGKLLPDPTHG